MKKEVFKIKKHLVDRKRNIFLIVSFVLIIVIYVLRLVDWQIVNVDEYKERAKNSNAYSIRTDAVRGEILDVNGIGLAVNDTGYRVILERFDIEKEKENKTLLTIIKLIESVGDTWIDVLPIEIKDDRFEFKDSRESQVTSLKKSLKLDPDATAEECMKIMIDKFDCKDYDMYEQRIISSARYNIMKGGSSYRIAPYIISDDVSQNTMLMLSELSVSINGLKVEPSLVRKYVPGTLAPHIIGYTGSMSSDEYEKRKDSYSMNEIIGKSGVESAMQDYLRGKAGRRIIQMARNGTIFGRVDRENAVPGNNVYLTIDLKVQEAANKSLQENIQKAQKMGVEDCKSGAAVMINVNDFSVIAASTYPTYDLNEFMGNSEYYPQLAADKEVQPLLNRAINGAFAPGSIYKPLIACAALQEGLVNDEETIHCNGGFRYYRGYTLKCMGVHGNIKLVNALARSCNVYFAELGRRLGAEVIASYAQRFGIGIKTGLEIYESTGIIAGPEYSKKVGATWYESGSSQAAIGQSDNMFTPLQLAVYTAMVANGGHRYKTHLVRKVMDYNNSNVIMENNPDCPELLGESGVSEDNLNIVRRGMRQVVLSGTAANFRNYPTELAAKTGTAQNSGNDHTTFICYAPYEKPEIAICVVVEHGKYGNISKDIAKDMLDAYFKNSTSEQERK